MVPLEFDFSTVITSLATQMTTNIGIALTAAVGVAGLLWGVRVGLRTFRGTAK